MIGCPGEVPTARLADRVKSAWRGLAGIAVGGLLIAGPSWARTDVGTASAKDGICQSSALIFDSAYPIGPITERTGGSDTVYYQIARGTNAPEPVRTRVPCPLQPGDKIIPLAGPGVIIQTWLGNKTLYRMGETYIVGDPIRPEGWANDKWDLFNQTATASPEAAQEIANAVVGAARASGRPTAARQPIGLLGAIGKEQQSVVTGQLLDIRWAGGASPFTVTLANTAAPPLSVANLENRRARLDLGAMPEGGARLTISDSDGARLVLPVRLVAPSSVPKPGWPDAELPTETRELAEATWLLTGDDVGWRMEALSRLSRLETDHGNPVAKSILNPVLPPDSPTRPAEPQAAQP